MKRVPAVSEADSSSVLYGIYGSHTTESCPVINPNVAKRFIAKLNSIDMDALAKECNIERFLGRYHSALEHTLIWIVEAQDSHLIQKFCIASGLAEFNKITIVPLITFDDVVDHVKRNHAL